MCDLPGLLAACTASSLLSCCDMVMWRGQELGMGHQETGEGLRVGGLPGLLVAGVSLVQPSLWILIR